MGVFGYIGVLYLKEHFPEVWHIPPWTPCIYTVWLIVMNGRERNATNA